MEMSKHFPAEQHLTLPNGLRVHLAPRPDFHQMAANLTVDFGGRDNHFIFDGKTYTQPVGVAHFLEHRMFGQPGYDAFQKLSELGADANAFTSQSRTSYYFTSLANNQLALAELLNFTQSGYFPTTDVQREAQIIAQEADMYQDNVDAQLYRQLLSRLYPGDLIAEEIVGNRASLSQIMPQTLQLAFDAFYQPANMDVFVTGAFDTAAVLATIQESVAAQRPKAALGQIVTPILKPVLTEPVEITLPTNRTKLAVGQRYASTRPLPTGRVALKEMMAVSLALDLVFSELSPRYMEWYDTSLIDDDFSVEFEWERGFAFMTIATDTNEPETLLAELQDTLMHLPMAFAKLRDAFDLVKKDAIGRTVSRFNFIEEIATSFEGSLFEASTVIDEYAILDTITADFVQATLNQADNPQISSIIVHPNVD